MNIDKIIDFIAKGRTEFILEFLNEKNWKELLHQGFIKPIQWLFYYNDLTAVKLILERGGSLDSIDLNHELGNAAFHGHWKICEFLIKHGANVNSTTKETNETPLHHAIVKAGRPYYFFVVKLLVEKGAAINPKTSPGKETGDFMRDVRTKGETPLHRAAAYADERTINFLLEKGADKTIRDMNGDTPLSWASEHLRPGRILSLLSFGENKIGEAHKVKNTSDHGQGWGNSMDWNLFGEYLPE